MRCQACNRSMLTAAITISKQNYGPVCAKRMGLLAPKPAKAVKHRKPRRCKGGEAQIDLFEELVTHAPA